MRPYAFGERLRAARQRRGWSQTELGKRASVHPMLISKLERGQNQDVKGETLRKLAYALEMSADWLIGLVDEEDEEDADDHATYQRTHQAVSAG